MTVKVMGSPTAVGLAGVEYKDVMVDMDAWAQAQDGTIAKSREARLRLTRVMRSKLT